MVRKQNNLKRNLKFLNAEAKNTNNNFFIAPFQDAPDLQDNLSELFDFGVGDDLDIGLNNHVFPDVGKAKYIQTKGDNDSSVSFPKNLNTREFLGELKSIDSLESTDLLLETKLQETSGFAEINGFNDSSKIQNGKVHNVYVQPPNKTFPSLSDSNSYSMDPDSNKHAVTEGFGGSTRHEADTKISKQPTESHVKSRNDQGALKSQIDLLDDIQKSMSSKTKIAGNSANHQFDDIQNESATDIGKKREGAVTINTNESLNSNGKNGHDDRFQGFPSADQLYSGRYVDDSEFIYAEKQQQKTSVPVEFTENLGVTVLAANVLNDKHGFQNGDSKFSYFDSNHNTVEISNTENLNHKSLDTHNNNLSLSPELRPNSSHHAFSRRSPGSPTRLVHSTGTVPSFKAKILHFDDLNPGAEMSFDDDSSNASKHNKSSFPEPESNFFKLPEPIPAESLSREILSSPADSQDLPNPPAAFEFQTTKFSPALLPVTSLASGVVDTVSLRSAANSPRSSENSHASHKKHHSRSHLSISSKSSSTSPQQFINVMHRTSSNYSLRQSLISNDAATINSANDYNPGIDEDDTVHNTLHTLLNTGMTQHSSSDSSKSVNEFYTEDEEGSDEGILATAQQTLSQNHPISTIAVPLSSLPTSTHFIDTANMTKKSSNNTEIPNTNSFTNQILPESSSYYPPSSGNNTVRNRQYSETKPNTNVPGSSNASSTPLSLPVKHEAPRTLPLASAPVIQLPPPVAVNTRSKSHASKTVKQNYNRFSSGNEDEANLAATARAAQLINAKRAELDAKDNSGNYYSLFSEKFGSNNIDADPTSPSASGPIVDENGDVLCPPTMEWFMLIFFTLFPLLWLFLACGGFDRVVGKVSRRTKIIAACLSTVLFLAAIAGLIIGLAVGLTRE